MSEIVRVKSKSPRGFWRCGRHFGPGWTEVPVESLTAQELERLKAEPNLVVEIPAAAPAEASAPAKPEADWPVTEVATAPDLPETPEPEPAKAPAETETKKKKGGK